MLLEARGNDHSAVQAQIDRLVNECSAICASLAMSNPSAIRTLHCSNFDGALMVQQGPSSSKWLSISVSSAQLSHVCCRNQAGLSFGSLCILAFLAALLLAACVLQLHMYLHLQLMPTKAMRDSYRLSAGAFLASTVAMMCVLPQIYAVMLQLNI